MTITAPSFDSNAAVRQYGVVDLMGRAAGFTGGNAMNYKEDRQGALGSYTYSVQGNILTSRAVIDQAESAFRNGGCDLADKLMRALEGGAMNGEGDSRCTSRGYPADAASIEVDLTGEAAGSYLRLSVAGGNMNAVTRIRTMFDSLAHDPPCGNGSRRLGRHGRHRTWDGGTRRRRRRFGRSGHERHRRRTGGAVTTGAAGAADAGTTMPGDDGGCSCIVSARPAAPSLILLLALALLRPRRRR